MTITILIEREGQGPKLTPKEEHELEISTAQALLDVIRGEGDYASRRIGFALRGERRP